MSMESENKELPVTASSPETSVPPNAQLSFRGEFSDPIWNERFISNVCDIIKQCGRFMDLRLLDGVTIGFDYDEALASVDLGYESENAKRYTNRDGLVGVGKQLRVLRDNKIKAHLVINANVLTALASLDEEMLWPTANILAHELAHVNVIAWFDDHSPDVLLKKNEGDWAVFSMRETAMLIWEEYAACRLSASVSSKLVGEQYGESVDLAVDGAVDRASNAVNSYRAHGDTTRLLLEAGACMFMPLKMAAYLLGHLDGVEDQGDFDELAPGCANSTFRDVISALHGALTKAWDTRTAWVGLAALDEIVEVLVDVLTKVKLKLVLNPLEPGSAIYVSQ